jgi:hypothetical protein
MYAYVSADAAGMTTSGRLAAATNAAIIRAERFIRNSLPET